MSHERNFTAAVAAGLLLFAVACGDDGTGPRPPAELVVVQSDGMTGEAGSEFTATVEARDASGNPMSSLPVSFSVVSGGGSVNPANAQTGADGRASTTWTLGTAAGDQTLRATSSGVTADINVSVTAGVPVVMEKVSGDEQIGEPGETLPEPLRVRLEDQHGNPVRDYLVQFVVSDGDVDPPSDATDANGIAETTLTLSGASANVSVVASATGAGQVEFTATVEASELTILTSRPREARLTLEYSEPLVAVGGAEDYSWEIQSGSLPPGIVLDGSTGILSGTPGSGGSFDFTVRVEDSAGDDAAREVTLLVCEAPTALTPGQIVTVDPTPPGACGFYLVSGSAGTRYRVGIVRPTSSQSASNVVTATFRIRGDGTTGTAASPLQPLVATVSERRAGGLDLAAEAFREALAIEDRTSAFHARLRRDEERLLRELGPNARVLESAPPLAATLRSGAAGAPQRRTFKPYSGQCSPAPSPRVAHLLGENQHVAIYQDSIQRAASPVSVSHVQSMLDYYRDYGVDVIDSYFGGISDIDGNGQVVVFISPVVETRVAAFVWSGDFFRSSGQGSCAASNEMELIYFNRAVISSMGANNHQALATLVHEVKHVSSLYKRIRSAEAGPGSALHPLWLEEGTAEIAAEVSSRLAWAANGGPAVGAAVRGSDITAATPENYGALLKLIRTMGYLTNQPNAVTTDPAGASDDHSIYGSGWHFHRFLGDAYGGQATAESDLFREQNDSLTVEGTAAFSGLVGRTFEELLEEYTAAIMLNGTGAPLPERAFRSYEFTTSINRFTTSPPGAYPWPVTDTTAVPLTSATYQGPLGPGGVRVHDFISNGSGNGADIHVSVPQPARLVVVRIE